MKFLPQNRNAKIRFVCLLLVLLGVAAYYRFDRVARYYFSDKVEGDIVFQSLPRGDLVDAIETITESPWSHCGVLLRKDGRWVVAEAIGEVRITPLHLWIMRGRHSRIDAYRVKDFPASALPALQAEIDKLMGRPYDYRYAPEDAEIYCSELVYKAYDRGCGIKIGAWENLGDLNWKPAEAFIRKVENGNLPLERPMISPVGLTRSERVERVY